MESRQIRASDSRPGDGEGRPDEIDALCALATTQPGPFVDNLDWQVAGDLAAISEMGPDEGIAAPFHSRLWLEGWLETLGRRHGARVRLVCGRLGNTILVAIPLCIEKVGPARRAAYLAQDVSDYNFPIFHHALAPHVDAPLLDAIWRRAALLIAGEVDYLSVRKQPLDPALPDGRAVWRSFALEAEASHWFAVESDWAASEERFFGHASRRSLTRKAKKLGQLGEVTCRPVENQAERCEAMRNLIAWKTFQLQELGAANPFRSEAFVQFLTRLSSGDPRVHRLYGLYAGDTLLAVTYVICGPQRWFLYQTAYTDQDARRFSPGLMLLRHILKEAHEAGASAFDFGLGNEGYKDRFCDRTIALYRAELPLSRLGHVAVAASALCARLRDLARTNPMVRRTVLAALRTLTLIRKTGGR